jgi:broad specificity phosphatase PhoE
VDADLNPTGEKQAAALGARLASETFSLVASSTLLRARHTADLLNDAHAPTLSTIAAIAEPSSVATPNLPIEGQLERPHARRLVLPELDEIDFGNLEGEANANARIAATLQEWARGNWAARVGADGESGADVAARVRSALQKLAVESSRASLASSSFISESSESISRGGGASGASGAAVVAVAHSTYIRVFLALACGLPLAACLALDQRNCCVNVLDVPLSMAELDIDSQPNDGASTTRVKATELENGAAAIEVGAFDPATLRAVNEVGHLAPLGLVHTKHAAPVVALQEIAASATCAYTQQRKPRSLVQ